MNMHSMSRCRQQPIHIPPHHNQPVNQSILIVPIQIIHSFIQQSALDRAALPALLTALLCAVVPLPLLYRKPRQQTNPSRSPTTKFINRCNTNVAQNWRRRSSPRFPFHLMCFIAAVCERDGNTQQISPQLASAVG